MKIATYPEVIGFSENNKGLKIELQIGETQFGSTIVNVEELLELDENFVMYFRDKNYYHREINDILQSYIAEYEGEYKIEKED